MEVSNGGTPNVWLLKENPYLEMDDEWGYPYDSGNLHMISWMLNTNIDKFYAVASNLKMSGILKRCFLKPFENDVLCLHSALCWIQKILDFSVLICSDTAILASLAPSFIVVVIPEISSSIATGGSTKLENFFLVGGWATPLWKIWFRQLGWWDSQYMGKCQKWQPNHQPVLWWFLAVHPTLVRRFFSTCCATSS